jgi:hypothetical protein
LLRVKGRASERLIFPRVTETPHPQGDGVFFLVL